jgi:hypothetical protein
LIGSAWNDRQSFRQRSITARCALSNLRFHRTRPAPSPLSKLYTRRVAVRAGEPRERWAAKHVEPEMSRNFKIVLAVAAVVITSALAVATGSFPLPFYVGIFYVGPFAFIWFLLPAMLVPFLATKVPVDRSHLLKLLSVATPAFVGVAAYLGIARSCCGNAGREFGWVAWWVALITLAVVAGLGLLRESRVVTVVFHIILVAWFVALGFPYLGEFL